LIVFTILNKNITEGKPGHMLHDYYKCKSNWYLSFLKECQDQRQGRNTRQINGSETQTMSTLLLSSVLLLWTII